MNGFLCIDKSPGMTSRDAVNVVQRLIKPLKIGHAGTLDPLATGVLVMAIGKATKLISHVQRMRKFYAGEFQLGKSSDTEDISGKLVTCLVQEPPTREQVDQACAKLVGAIAQLPPRYSALRVEGRRAHELARAGQRVNLQPRCIEVHEIAVGRYEYPNLALNVECGSGTYIRSLGRDIGADLGCGAVMSALRRTRIGKFCLEESISVERLQSRADVEESLLPLSQGVDLSCHHVSPAEQRELQFGRSIACDHDDPQIAAIGPNGELLAVLQQIKPCTFRPSINLSAT